MKLLKTFGIYTVSLFFNKSIAFILLPLFTTYLLPSDYGIVTLMSNSVNFLTPFIGLSITTSINTDFFKLDQKKFAQFFSTIIVIPLTLTIVSLLVIAIFGKPISKFLEIEPIYLYCIPLLTVSNLFFELLLIIFRNRQSVIGFVVATALKTFLELALALFFIVKLGMKWEGRIIGWILVGIGFMIYSIYYFYKEKFITKNVDWTFIVPELKYSIPLIISQIAVFVINASDKFFLAEFQNKTEVGIYGVASQVALIVIMFAQSILASFQPFLFEALANFNTESKKNIAKKIFLFILFMLVGLIGLNIFAPLVYKYFIGANYLIGLKYVFSLSIGCFFWSIYSILLCFFYFYKEKKILVYISLLTVFLSVSLNYILIHQYGTYGACLAYVISTFIILLTSASIVYTRYFKEIPPLKLNY